MRGGKGLQDLSDSAGRNGLPSKAGSASSGATPAVGSDATSDGPVDGNRPAAAKGKPQGGGLDNLASSLRHAYECTLEEPIPDSILDLLRQLD